MKPTNELTDQEFAEAVAVEVLGAKEYYDEWHIFGVGKVKDECLNTWLLSAQGREAIEDELERRGWEYQLTFVAWSQSKDAPFFLFDIAEELNREPADTIYLAEVSHKNKYRAIPEAALQAVRAERREG